MHCAAINNHTSIVKRLVRCGATVDVDNESNKTPLWYAAYNGYENCVRLLLMLGANPHRKR